MREVLPEETEDVYLRDHEDHPISAAKDDAWFEEAYLDQVGEEHQRAAMKA